MTKFKPGDLLHFYPEELTILVVMASDEGLRYIEPANPQFDDNGNLITFYIDNKALMEWTNYLGKIDDISSAIISNRIIKQKLLNKHIY